MTRFLSTAFAVVVLVGSVAAQGIRDPNPPRVPSPQPPFLPPPFIAQPTPGNWWGPTMPYSVAPNTYGPFLPYSNFVAPRSMSSLLFSQQEPGPNLAPPLEGAGVNSAIIVNPNLVAEFAVQFPSTAEVWVNGKKQSGSREKWTLTSPPLTGGDRHTFDVKASWTADGDRYEWTRTITLGSGERSKANVFGGTKAK